MRRRIRDDAEVGELNIIPYLDIVTNLVMFMLLSMAGLISLGVLGVDTPKTSEGGSASVAEPNPDEKPPLMLTIGITDRGFFIAGSGGVLGGASGESNELNTAAEPSLPRINGQYDYAGLTRMVAGIKDRYQDEKQVILAAEANIPYDVIIQVMDACREQVTQVGELKQRRKLFPQVLLSTMR